MLGRDQLAGLYRELLGERVLSVYLDGGDRDPGRRQVWRMRFEHAVDRALETTPAEELPEFRAALEHVRREIDTFDSLVPGEGWVGFATPDGLRYAELVPVRMPDLVRWERGIRVAPYLRALLAQRPLVTVLVDSRRARVLLHRGGSVEERSDYRADTFLGDLSDQGSARWATTHTGTRGGTASDAARRYLDVGTERMLKEVAADLPDLLGREGCLLVGGTPESATRFAALLPREMAERTLVEPSLHLGMSTAELRRAAEEAADVLRIRRQERLVNDVVERAHGGGNGCLGREETARALREGRVDTLLLTPAFVARDADTADRFVGAAFRQDADVVELLGEPAARMDREGEGIGARLRYRVPRPEEGGAPEEGGDAALAAEIPPEEGGEGRGAEAGTTNRRGVVVPGG